MLKSVVYFSLYKRGQNILTIAVLSIIATAPLGAMLINITGRLWLHKEVLPQKREIVIKSTDKVTITTANTTQELNNSIDHIVEHTDTHTDMTNNTTEEKLQLSVQIDSMAELSTGDEANNGNSAESVPKLKSS